MTRVLLLGGTTEASLLARALADAGVDAVFSYAGRTTNPVQQPLPQRIGGFGGVEGLVAYLRQQCITHVVDATHPFAAGMSHNAEAACRELGVPLAACERPGWTEEAGDSWTRVTTIRQAAIALPLGPTRVFLAIGRQHLSEFAALNQHHYLLRLVDPPPAPPLPNCTVVVERGPFDHDHDVALLRGHDIRIVVAKNSGGSGAASKLTAARILGLQVILIDRPALPVRPSFATAAEVMAWIDHGADLGL